jgi:hypothetical protein
MQYGVERRVIDRYLPNQMNSPSCLVTVYVLTVPVRHWPSFRRGEDDELAEPATDWPSFTRGDVGVIKKTSRGLGKENNKPAVCQCDRRV